MTEESSVFDIATPTMMARSKQAGRFRVVWLVVAVLFGLSGLALALKSIAVYPTNIPLFLTAAASALFFLYGTLLALFEYAFVARSPPTRLRLTPREIELIYPDERVRFSKRWDDPQFKLLLRDFRGWNSPMSQELVLDTGSESLARDLYPNSTPPSAYLPLSAFEAILEQAREHGLDVSTKKAEGIGKSGGWGYYNTEIRISRRPASHPITS